MNSVNRGRYNMMEHQRIGIIGGTFDPIHYGHLILAEHVREKAMLDKVIFIPAMVPPHKQDLSITESSHRLAMVLLAIDSNAAFEASDLELSLKGISYTIHTLAKLKIIYGNDTAFYFITGSDTIFEIEKWHDYKTLLKSAGFIVGNRPGFREGALDRHVAYLNQKYGSAVSIVAIPEVDISSTEIKRRVRERESIRYLVPESVENYIFDHGLYK